jgi:hypothetical protein
MNERMTQDTAGAQGSFTEYGRLLDVRDYKVLDPAGEKIGKVDDMFVGTDGQPRYLAVRMGFLGTKSTILPVQLVNGIDTDDEVVFVTIPKDMAKDGPAFDRDYEFTTEDEVQIWQYYGLGEPVYVVTEFIVWEQAS